MFSFGLHSPRVTSMVRLSQSKTANQLPLSYNSKIYKLPAINVYIILYLSIDIEWKTHHWDFWAAYVYIFK